MDIVLKYGRETLTNGGLGLDIGQIDSHMADVASFLKDPLSQEPRHITIVASAATEAGRKEWHDLNGDLEEPSDQILAMIGQGIGSVTLQHSLARFGVTSAPVWVTHQEIDDREEQPVFKGALLEAKASFVVPIINENAAFSVEELAKLAYGGDNDGIASHTARVTAADALIIYTASGGLLDATGREISRVSDDSFSAAMSMVVRRERERRSNTNLRGKGGMPSKLRELKKAANAGVRSFAARQGTLIEDVLAGKSGTEILGKAV